MLLYLHVPFCARRCSYCDFAIAVRRRVPSDGFVETVLAEWRGRAEAWREAGPLETIYFGGGTPSRLAPNAIARLVERVAGDQGLSPDAEVTLEANPEDVSLAGARAWRSAGVNRVSLGVQSFAPDVLAWMHRTHDAAAPERAVAALRSAGIGNVSLDLIYGLPESLRRDWGRDLASAFALEPDHLSLYGLTVETHTPLGRWVDRGESVPADDSRAAAEYLDASGALRAHGFRHYEVSNAGRPGRESRHNRGYWERRAYLGLGPSAHSAMGERRWWNVRDWEAYRRTVAREGVAVAGAETLSPEQARLEEVYLGLRTDAGVAASSLPPDSVDRWLAAEWASRRDNQIVLTAEGWLRLDALVSRV